MTSKLKWKYDVTTFSELEKYRVSANSILKILVYGLTVSGAEEVRITLREGKYTLETPYSLPLDCVETWLGYREGKGPLYPLESNELGKIFLAEVARGAKIRVATPQYVAVIDGEGAAITDTANSHPSKTSIEIHKPNLSPWWDYSKLNEGLREVKVPTTVEMYTDKEMRKREFPSEGKSGKVIWQSQGVTIEKFEGCSHGDVVVNGVSLSFSPLPSRLVAKVEGQVDVITIHGVEVRLPNIVTPDCTDLRALSIIADAKDIIEELELSKDWLKELTRLTESRLTRVRETLDRLTRTVKENPKFTSMAEVLVPHYAEMLEAIEILLTEVTYYGYARERLSLSNGRAPLVHILNVNNNGYVRKRLTAPECRVLSTEKRTVVYVDDPRLIRFLEKMGVKEVSVRKPNLIATYAPKFTGLEKAKYYDLHGLAHFALTTRTLVVYTDKITSLKDESFPPTVVIIKRNKKLKELKAILGELLVSYEDYTKMTKKLTLVTDGKKVYTLSELPDSKKYYLISDNRTELLPYLNKIARVYAVLPFCNWRGISIKTFVDRTKAWSKVRHFLNEEAADLLRIIINSEIAPILNPSYKHLVRLLEEVSGIEKGLSIREITEAEKEKIRSIAESVGILRLGQVSEKLTGLAETTNGLPVINPLLPPEMIATSEKLRDLRDLQLYLKYEGSAIFAGMDHLAKDVEALPEDVKKVVSKYTRDTARAKELALSFL
ncbi:SNARE domain-containing protein [Archaeoglobus neptunius]|uniref:hypothetical protein n=1 Tax=Archaeoglobus neptunius TaxID=2798580 RepID=UPI001926F718|nr:hypothetical protein [Archaeoglobus neptunius]